MTIATPTNSLPAIFLLTKSITYCRTGLSKRMAQDGLRSVALEFVYNIIIRQILSKSCFNLPDFNEKF